MLLQTDARRRITLPTNSGIKPGDALDLEVMDDGRTVLVPVAVIPKHQLWAWTPECNQIIEAAVADPRPRVVIETPEQLEEVTKGWLRED